MKTKNNNMQNKNRIELQSRSKKEIIETMTGFEREENIVWEFKLISSESTSIKRA